MYLEEQANLCFTNQRLQTEKEKYEQQLQEEKEEEKVNNGKKRASPATPTAGPRTMPLPSIDLTYFWEFGMCVVCTGIYGKRATLSID
jgi:hypothetical protein